MLLDLCLLFVSNLTTHGLSFVARSFITRVIAVMCVSILAVWIFLVA